MPTTFSRQPGHGPSRRQILLAASASLAPCLVQAQAQASLPAWPTRPVRILTPFTAGGSTDLMARHLATLMSTVHKQPFNVEGKPGADGALAAQELLRAPNDGHTIYLATASALSYVPNVRKNPGYYALKDFTLLAQFITYSFYLMVHQSLPGKTLAEVVAHVKANPGKYSYASGNSTALLAAAQLATSGGLDMASVPYKGESMALPDMVGGRVHMMWTGPSSMPPLVKDNVFRPMAVLLPERAALMPDVPTIGQAGMPLVNVVPWGGFVMSATTPKDTAAAVSKALREAIAHPDLRGPADQYGLVLRPGTGEVFGKFLAEQMVAYGQAIKLAKIPEQS